MKTFMIYVAATSLLAAVATAQPHYRITDIGPADSPFGFLVMLFASLIFERSARQRCCRVPSSLRSSAPAQRKR